MEMEPAAATMQSQSLEGAEAKDDFILTTNRLPTDLSFMPTLGNGHLGFTVYGDAIFMNGLYNGRGGDSRRARIPNWLNVSVGELQAAEDAQYELLLQDGYFRSVRSLGGVQVEERFYAHRYFTRALVYELSAKRCDVTAPLSLTLSVEPGRPSNSFNFAVCEPRMLKGVTRAVEHEMFQNDGRPVYIAFSESLHRRKRLLFNEGATELHFRYVLSIDGNRDVARKELKDVLAVGTKSLLALHCAEWRTFWNGFSIGVEGNMQLAQTINAGLFYLANSLPSPRPHQPNAPYFGLSPTGLGRGNLDTDYEGHSFWDTEVWMLPVVTQMDPNWAKALFRYRLDHLPGAEFNALMTGYPGARFPWESAFTGTEVAHPDFPELAEHQVHISADVLFALQQFYATTNDREWLRSDAWPLAEKIAAFLVTRTEQDPLKQEYHIKDVMGPDEDHCGVIDNVYTNVVFKIALDFASYMQEQLFPEASAAAAEWKNVAEKLTVLYDATLDYHPEYLGYDPQEKVKQADVVLVGFPLQFPMETSTRLNDLNTYAAVTRLSGPAMTWSMFAISYLDVGEFEKAGMYFERCFKNYVRPDFKVWSETAIGFAGSTNFLTGIGGFLQVVIAGYGGVRFHRRVDRSVMEIKATRLLPNTTQLTIQGLKFADAIFKLTVAQPASTLECLSLGQQELEFEMGDVKTQLFKGCKMALNDTAFITTI